jgi:hypothetical protein
MRTYTTIDDVLHVETKPRHYAAVYPFAVTLHVPEAFKLRDSELAVIKDAIVGAAYRLRQLRGGECNFAVVRGGQVDWAAEGFPQGPMPLVGQKECAK